MSPRPFLLATVICDTFYQDKDNKFILVGTFNTLRARQFPTQLHTFGIYIAASSLPSNGKLVVVFRHEDEDFSLTLPGWEVRQAPEDRTEVVEFAGKVNGLPIPKSGKYEFVILWNGIELGRRTFIAMETPKQGGESGLP